MRVSTHFIMMWISLTLLTVITLDAGGKVIPLIYFVLSWVVAMCVIYAMIVETEV